MLRSSIIILISLATILFSCYIFTNGIETLGKVMKISSCALGSIFAALGTALPETIIPIIAILYYNDERSRQIGIGAIAGAPFMLSTLTFFVTGAAVLIYFLLGKRSLKMNADISSFSRDITFFLVLYSIAILTTFLREIFILKVLIAIGITLSYIIYLRLTFSDICETSQSNDELLFSKYFKVKENIFWVIIQCLFALIIMLFCSNLFVKHIEDLSTLIGISPLILAIIITPIATELPEKFNSIIWTGKSKDTLAVGNIVGSMVFQSCFPVAFGIVFTPWNITGITLLSAVIALFSASINLIWVKVKGSINPFVLMSGGILYIMFLFKIFHK